MGKGCLKLPARRSELTLIVDFSTPVTPLIHLYTSFKTLIARAIRAMYRIDLAGIDAVLTPKPFPSPCTYDQSHAQCGMNDMTRKRVFIQSVKKTVSADVRA
jgi:hypothetical protein